MHCFLPYNPLNMALEGVKKHEKVNKINKNTNRHLDQQYVGCLAKKNGLHKCELDRITACEGVQKGTLREARGCSGPSRLQ